MTAQDHLIVAADAADFPRLARLETAGDAQFPPGRFPGEPGSDNVPIEEFEAGVADGLLWIAVAQDHDQRRETAERADGFALCVERGDHLHLRQLVVEPSLQRLGIGTLFLNWVRAEAVSRGCSAVTLTTFSDIPWNGPYYLKQGYRAMRAEELTPELREDLDAERSAGMRERIAMIRFNA
jgi:GNAT superfamily N-acetyltransferase